MTIFPKKQKNKKTKRKKIGIALAHTMLYTLSHTRALVKQKCTPYINNVTSTYPSYTHA